MFKYHDISKISVSELIKNYDFIVCRVRDSRIKSVNLAIKETVFALNDFNAAYLFGGPLSDMKGTYIILVPKENSHKIIERLEAIGYTDSFFLIDFNNPGKNKTDLGARNLVWKKKEFTIENFYKQNAELYVKEGADKRPFKILDSEDRVKNLSGYRGDGSETGRRALPVEDCKVLLNLSVPREGDVILDPFAGGGGIVYQAIKQGLNVYTSDIDKTVAPGLESYGSYHSISDARDLNFKKDTFDIIVTEVPFSDKATETVVQGLANVIKFLKPDGRLSLMCADYQVKELGEAMQTLKLKEYNSSLINRKGTSVAILCYTKSYELYGEIQKLNQTIRV